MIVEHAFEKFGLTEIARKYPKTRDVYVLEVCRQLGVVPQSVTAEQRKLAKAMMYGRVYGASPERLDDIATAIREAQF